MRIHLLSAVCSGVVVLAPVTASAVQIMIPPEKDNSLYEDLGGSLSNGAGEFIYAGRTAFAGVRRALLEFDIDGNIPAGSTIIDVQLSLRTSMAPPGNPPQPFTLHRVLSEWGEGTSDAGMPGGMGAPSTPGDATWIHTFFNSSFWASAGGDYVASASGGQLIPSNPGFNTFGPTTGMISDVQTWLDDPSQNHGWILIGNEAELQTARRFDSKDHSNSNNHPELLIEYLPPPPCPEDTNGDNMVNGIDLVNVILDWGTDGSVNNGDVDGSGTVDGQDLVAVILAWGPC